MRLQAFRRKLTATLSAVALTAVAVGTTTALTQTAASAVGGTVSGIVYRDWNYTGSTTDRFAPASSNFVLPTNFNENRQYYAWWWNTWTIADLTSSSDRRFRSYLRNQEPTEAGITINVTDNAGVSVGTATTGADGLFSISVTAPTASVRVEMSIPASKSHLVPGPKGARNKGNVQFVTLGTDSTNLYFSVVNPTDYCKHDSSAVLRLITPCWKFGDQKGAPLSALDSLPFDTPHSGSPIKPPVVSEATTNDIGTTYGLAWDPYRQNLFAAAYMRRHAGFGPSGTGAIYKIAHPGTAPKAVSVYADLNALFGAGTAGVDPHPTGGAPGCSGAQIYNSAMHAGPATACELAWGHDNQGDAVLTDSTTTSSYDKVGKISLGDMEISEDGTYLYVVNMADKKIYRMSAVTAPTTSAAVTTATIPLAASGTGGTYKCAAADSRPMALTIRDGVGYVGVTCSQESGASVSDPRAYVYQFNPVTMAFTAAPAVQFKWDQAWTNYRTGASFTPWTNTWIAKSADWHERNAQFMLSSIAFDDNDMLIGVRNRFHDQIGANSFDISNNESNRTNPMDFDGGGIIRACPSAAKWAVEGNNVDAPTFDEFTCTGGYRHWDETESSRAVTTYGTKSLFTNSTEWTEGAIVMLQGTQSRRTDLYLGSELATQLDGGKLISTSGLPGGTSFSNGISSYSAEKGWNLVNGAWNYDNFQETDGSNYSLYNAAIPSDSVLEPPTFGKANGLGDLEVLCLYAPIDIGDRVWTDTNNDGIQQAGEPGLGNVSVQLMQGVTSLATATTDANGNYLFSSRSGSVSASERFGITNLSPNQTGFTVKVATSGGGITASMHLTTRSAGTSGKFDSDALPGGATTSFDITTSYAQSFDFDFGFCTSLSCTAGVAYAIGDVVFTDTNGNGTKDVGEVGQSGINVELLNATTMAVIAGPVTTSGTGAYVFDSLAAGTYKVRFSALPSGSTWATQTVGTDTLVDSNPDATTGVTATITLGTSGNPNIRAAVSGDGVTATQIDSSIDAGVRPPAVVVGSTICVTPT
jgi:SdrD B-like domain